MSADLKITVSLPDEWIAAMQTDMTRRGVKMRTDYIRQALFNELRKAGFTADALAPKEASQ